MPQTRFRVIHPVDATEPEEASVLLNKLLVAFDLPLLLDPEYTTSILELTREQAVSHYSYMKQHLQNIVRRRGEASREDPGAFRGSGPPPIFCGQLLKKIWEHFFKKKKKLADSRGKL